MPDQTKGPEGQRTGKEDRIMQVYDPRAVQPDRDHRQGRYVQDGERTAFASWAEAVQGLVQQQMEMLQQFDRRLDRLENGRSPSDTGPINQRSWWILWTVTMILIGAALAIVIAVILLQLLR